MIYFIQAGTEVKIGTAIDVRKRVKLLQTGNAYNLRVLGVMAGGLEQERALHDGFAYLRVRGEWFRLSDEILYFVEANCRPYLRDLRHTGWNTKRFSVRAVVARAKQLTARYALSALVIGGCLSMTVFVFTPFFLMEPSSLPHFDLMDFSRRHLAAEHLAYDTDNPIFFAAFILSMLTIPPSVLWVAWSFAREADQEIKETLRHSA